jgi:uncharacterized membrane protein
MTRADSKWPAVLFFALYWLLLAGFYWQILESFSWLGFAVSGIAALFFAMAVRGMVKRKAEGRPVVSLEFFWGVLTAILLGLSGLLFWAGDVTPDHVVIEEVQTTTATPEKIWALVSNPMERPKWDPYLEKVEVVKANESYKFFINATGTQVEGLQKVVELVDREKIVFEIVDELAANNATPPSVKNVRSGFYIATIGSDPALKVSTSFDVDGLFAKMMVALLSKKFMRDTLREQLTNIKGVAEGKIERVQSKAAHFLPASPTPGGLPDQPGQGANRDNK